MADAMRVMLELGPKGKRTVAVAPDWPGLERGATTEEAALARLREYLPRYAPVARLAGLGAAFPVDGDLDVVERYPGTGSTDFWGISFAFADFDKEAITDEALERELGLMRASWAFFDATRGRVSADLRKGPRGGGRDREQIVRHTLGAELQWARKLGVRPPDGALLTDDGLAAYRADYCAAIRACHVEGKPARTWPLRYLIRHTAFHTLDHAWEMADKDLNPVGQAAKS